MNNDRESTLSAPRADGVAGRHNANLSDRVRSLRLNDQAGERRGAGGFLPWALCVFLLLTSVAFGAKALRPRDPTTEELAAAASAARPAGSADGAARATTTTSPTAGSGEIVLEAKGYVMAAHQIQVSPKVAGMIVWLNDRFEEGQRFEKGDVLARLESDDYEADVNRAKASVNAAEKRLAEQEKTWPLERQQAEARLASARTNMDYRRRERDRMQRSGTGISAKERDEAESLHDQAVKAHDETVKAVELLGEVGPRASRIASAKAEVEQARAELAKAAWRLKQCEMVAPVTGRILTKKAEKGNLVNSVAFTGSTSLCEMADLADLEIDLSIQERDIASVSVGQESVVMPEAFVKNEAFRAKYPLGYKGVVSRLMPIADRAKGAIPVRVKIDRKQIPPEEEGVFLKPDISVIVSFKKK